MKVNILSLLLLASFFSCAISKEQKADQKSNGNSEFSDSVLAGQTIMVSGGQLGEAIPKLGVLSVKEKLAELFSLNRIRLIFSGQKSFLTQSRLPISFPN